MASASRIMVLAGRARMTSTISGTLMVTSARFLVNTRTSSSRLMRKTFHSVTPNLMSSLAMSAFVMSQISRVRYQKYDGTRNYTRYDRQQFRAPVIDAEELQNRQI